MFSCIDFWSWVKCAHLIMYNNSSSSSSRIEACAVFLDKKLNCQCQKSKITFGGCNLLTIQFSPNSNSRLHWTKIKIDKIKTESELVIYRLRRNRRRRLRLPCLWTSTCPGFSVFSVWPPRVVGLCERKCIRTIFVLSNKHEKKYCSIKLSYLPWCAFFLLQSFALPPRWLPLHVTNAIKRL